MSHRIIIDLDHDENKIEDIHYTKEEFLEAGGKLPDELEDE